MTLVRCELAGTGQGSCIAFDMAGLMYAPGWAVSSTAAVLSSRRRPSREWRPLTAAHAAAAALASALPQGDSALRERDAPALPRSRGAGRA